MASPPKCNQRGPACGRAIKNLTTRPGLVALVVGLGLLAGCLAASADSSTPVLSSRAAFLRAQRGSRQQQQQANSTTNQTAATTAGASSPAPPTSAASAPAAPSTSSSTTASPAPAASRAGAGAAQPASSTTSRPRAASSKPKDEAAPPRATSLASQPAAGVNRAARTADVFQNGDGYNIFVTNTCEREQMQVKITTSKEFNGVIHTRNQRQKAACTVEGDGGTEYNMVISHVLNASDPNYCGVIKARRESPEDKDLLSVVIAVRFHRNIELSDDKFFLLNCTNRCRKPDCSSPSEDLTAARRNENARLNLRPEDGSTELGGAPGANAGEREMGDECTIWKFPWVIALLWAMGIFLAVMMIAMCVMCSSLVCRRVKTEVVERAPSVYEDDTTDDEDRLYNRKNHPMRIDYDNRDIYKTSNNYEPYCLDEAQAAERKQREKRARKSRGTQRR